MWYDDDFSDSISAMYYEGGLSKITNLCFTNSDVCKLTLPYRQSQENIWLSCFKGLYQCI